MNERTETRADDASVLAELSGPLARAMLDAAKAARVGLVVSYVDGPSPRNAYVSDTLVELLGYSKEELLERSPFSYVAPGEVARLEGRHAERRAGKEGAATFEATLIRRDGQRVECEVTTSTTTLHGRRATVAFVVDVTARLRATEALSRTEASFRELIEVAPDPIGIVKQGRFVYVNPAYVETLGYGSAEELQGVALADLVYEEDIAVQRLREERLLATGRRNPPHTYRVRRPDGTDILLEVSSIGFEYQGSVALLSIARDVTQRRRLEAQLEKADRLAALGTLAAGVAHEVNNPLAYLLLNLEWVARQLPVAARNPQRLEQLSGILSEARQGAERVAQIVRDLRAFSRVDGETRGPVDLRQVVTNALKICAHELQRRARVVTAFEDVPMIWANEARLEQVLLNLLLNAGQAMPENTFETNEIRVVVRRSGASQVVMTVSDTGAGIPPEMLRRIFDPFFTTKPVGQGTGLGLSICHSIVASLGGEITVESAPSEGTTFRVVLPVRVPAAHDAPASVSPSSAPRSALRGSVLVVDDEPQIAHTLKDLLSGDHDVVAVASGKAALDVIRGGTSFDVIFCDLMMPEMTGIELFEKLRAERRGLEDRVVFMTGGAFTPLLAEFLTNIKNPRLEKPFAVSAIKKLVRDAARAREAR